MFVRVFDKDKNTYYKSLVYAIVSTDRCWFLQYIVLCPHTNTFELVDYCDESVTPAKPLVEIIQSDYSNFITYEGAVLLKYKHYCRKNRIEFTDVKRIVGYPDVCENYAFLADVFTKKSVSVEDYNISILELKDTAEWNYIFTQSDADEFMKSFAGFHDSALKKINYLETNGLVTANVVFDNSGWFGVVELCFEGIQMLKITPTRGIYEASLIIENESVFWADSYMEKPDSSYGGSIIRALNLKWRKI